MEEINDVELRNLKAYPNKIDEWVRINRAKNVSIYKTMIAAAPQHANVYALPDVETLARKMSDADIFNYGDKEKYWDFYKDHYRECSQKVLSVLLPAAPQPPKD